MQFKQPLYTCVAGALGLAVSAGAMAQDNVPQDKRFYVAPMVSYGFFDSDTIGSGSDSFGRLNVDNDDSVGASLAIGKPITSWLNLELFGFYFNPDQSLSNNAGSDSAGDADLYGFGLDALFFPARDTFPIYGILGAAWGKKDVGFSSINGVGVGDDADADFLDAGVGYMYTLNDYGLKVRAEYRYRYTTVDSADVLGAGYEDARYNDHIVSVGLQVPIGAPPQAPAPAPAPEPVGPQDSDGDGVIDANDQCPGTPRGTEVDARGCPIEKKAPIVLKGVTFEFDSSKLTAQATNRLDNVVDALEASPDVNFRVDGYTDSIGTDRYNLDLSQRRVDSVRSYLMNHGITSSRITGTQGHGESNPVATNETAAGRAQNRRVELNVTNQGGM
ncbi:OmpA family protein [uncultured Salinisphaera sp.]|uniref:OmpA family protein n=1 Tax=uncultured Salinisphaera sp. TaxID=359372 RepID=UPI0032B2B071|tara:strand:- start:2415 stop:3578 length:1164 start_codon:yes stop_codon:yes gene_type:complete